MDSVNLIAKNLSPEVTQVLFNSQLIALEKYSDGICRILAIGNTWQRKRSIVAIGNMPNTSHWQYLAKNTSYSSRWNRHGDSTIMTPV